MPKTLSQHCYERKHRARLTLERKAQHERDRKAIRRIALNAYAYQLHQALGGACGRCGATTGLRLTAFGLPVDDTLVESTYRQLHDGARFVAFMNLRCAEHD